MQHDIDGVLRIKTANQVKVKVTLSTRWRDIEEAEIQLPALLASSIDGGVNDQLRAPVALPPETVWTVWRK